MAGQLSNEINNTEKISVFVGECKRMGIAILPPDINRSGLKFTPETVAGIGDAGNRTRQSQAGVSDPGYAIRYGLAAIKHVGESAMATAIRERAQRGDFTSLEEFCNRLESRIANRKILESMVKDWAVGFMSHVRTEIISCISSAILT